MTKKTNTFRLIHLFNSSYLAGRLSEIKSVSDAIRRAGRVLIYIGYMILNGCYKAIGFLILAWRAAVNFLFSIKRKINGFYCSIRGLIVFLRVPGGEKIFYLMKSDANDLKAIKILFSLMSRFTDSYRDFFFKRGLDGLKPIANTKMKRVISMIPEAFYTPIRALWLLHPFCNYKCSYCWMHIPNRPMFDGEEGYIRKSPQDYSLYWKRFNQRYGPAKIEVLGGEPFLYSDFPDILEDISVKNAVSVVTNLSWEPEAVIGRINPKKVIFVASYHPEDAPSIEKFIDKIIALQRAGFFITAGVVAWPPHLPKIPSMLKKFYDKGIRVLVEPFVGARMGRVYPQSYTDFEKKAIKDLNSGKYMERYNYENEVIGEWREDEYRGGNEMDLATSFQLSNASPKGKPCNAGRSYCRILYNGEVMRCFQGGGLGNFFSGEFSLLDQPEPCPFDKCECIGENLCFEGVEDGSKHVTARGIRENL